MAHMAHSTTYQLKRSEIGSLFDQVHGSSWFIMVHGSWLSRFAPSCCSWPEAPGEKGRLRNARTTWVQRQKAEDVGKRGKLLSNHQYLINISSIINIINDDVKQNQFRTRVN